jgi:hypothetical protein
VLRVGEVFWLDDEEVDRECKMTKEGLFTYKGALLKKLEWRNKREKFVVKKEA